MPGGGNPFGGAGGNPFGGFGGGGHGGHSFSDGTFNIFSQFFGGGSVVAYIQAVPEVHESSVWRCWR